MISEGARNLWEERAARFFVQHPNGAWCNVYPAGHRYGVEHPAATQYGHKERWQAEAYAMEGRIGCVFVRPKRAGQG